MSLRRTQIRALERSILVEEALSNVRHDLRNKLANVRNAVFYIRRRLEQGAAPVEARIAAFLKLIDAELAAADQMIGTGLAHSAKEDKSPIDLLECAAFALRLAAPPPMVKIDNLLQPREGLHGAPEAVALLLRLLIEDAISAMPEGGQLTLSSAEAAAGVILSVVDNRKGDQDHAEHAEQQLIKLAAARCHATLNVMPISQGRRIDVLLPAASP
jgi:signal transduction histidine kinase